jgi:hypothetical protein
MLYNAIMTLHSLTTLSNSSATRLTPNGIHSGMDITIQNIDSSAYVYIGGEGVDSENFGYRISPDNAWSIELSGRDAIYAISSTEGSVVAILRTSLESGN